MSTNPPPAVHSKFWEAFSQIIGKLSNEFLLFTLGFILLIIAIGIFAPGVVPLFGRELFYLLFGLAFVVYAVLLVLHMREAKSRAPSPELPPVQVFDRSESPEFVEYFGKLVRQAKHRIVMIGTGINILHQDPIFQALIEGAKKNCNLQVEIFAANPFSPAVETRLIEEETGIPRPNIGKPGLIQWLRAMLEERRRLLEECERMGNPPNFTLQLFSHYPTLAMFILDDKDYFFYPYGYAYLGTLSPVIHCSKNSHDHNPIIEFLDLQYKRVKSSAVDAQLIYDAHTKNTIGPQLREKLVPFAVYIVPEAGDPLYKFGSEVLGYDLRRQTVRKVSHWGKNVGAAANFGFHLTVADALYFAHKDEIELLGEEIEFILRDPVKGFGPFSLGLEMKVGFPNDFTIALVCRDESGSLEALHHEMVARCYRRAIASNYSLGDAALDRDLDYARASLMVQHYRAPYILQRYTPHFTLLDKVPESPEQRKRILQELVEKLHEAKVPMKLNEAGKPVLSEAGEPTILPIDIRRVALLTKPEGEQRWKIIREIHLRGA